MAKNAGRLAGLAALAGAAYMMSKGKDKESGTTDSNPTRAARPESTETGRMTDEEKAEMKRETQRGPIASIPSKTTPKPVVTPSIKAEDLKPVSEPSDKRVKLAPENRDLEASTSRGSRKSESTVSSSEEGMQNYKPRRTPEASTTSSSEAGMKNYTPRYTPPSSTVSSTPEGMAGYKTRAGSAAGAGRGGVNPKPVTPQQPLRDLEATMSRGRRQEQPGPGQAQIDTVRRLQSAANVPSSMAGRPGFDESGKRMPSMAGRPGYDEAGNPMKRGGMVKKMASGGMTSKVSSASKRADGIASRGKTKCKMY